MKWSFIVLGAVFAAAIAGGIAALCRKRPEKSNDDIDGDGERRTNDSSGRPCEFPEGLSRICAGAERNACEY